MNAVLRKSLQETIYKWVEDESMTDEWTDENAFFGNCLADLMTDAAVTVFDAQVDVNRYFEKEKLNP